MPKLFLKLAIEGAKERSEQLHITLGARLNRETIFLDIGCVNVSLATSLATNSQDREYVKATTHDVAEDSTSFVNNGRADISEGDGGVSKPWSFALCAGHGTPHAQIGM